LTLKILSKKVLEYNYLLGCDGRYVQDSRTYSTFYTN